MSLGEPRGPRAIKAVKQYIGEKGKSNKERLKTWLRSVVQVEDGSLVGSRVSRRIMGLQYRSQVSIRSKVEVKYYHE